MPKEENIKPDKKVEEQSEPNKEYGDDVNGVYEKSDKTRSNKPWFIAAFVIIVILIIALIGSMFKLHNVRQNYYNRGTTFINNRGDIPHVRSNFFFSSSDSSGTSSSSASVISGVVTKVSGDSFDVGGSGTKTTVKTNGDTTWNTTAKKVSVNDSVIVYGSESDNKITATSVQIRNL